MGPLHTTGLNKRSIVHFETLPNELFYSLFAYFDNDECYTSFFGIHSRLNGLLSTHFISLSPFRQLISPNTVHSITPSNIHISLKKHSFQINLTQFHKTLYSITIDYLAVNYVNQMYTLEHLTILRIKDIPDELIIQDQLRKLLISLNQLQQLSLPYWCFTGSAIQLPSLHSLHLCSERNGQELGYLMDSLPKPTCLLLYCEYTQFLTTRPHSSDAGFNNLRYFRLHLSKDTYYAWPTTYLEHMLNLERFDFSTTLSHSLTTQTDIYDRLNDIGRTIEEHLPRLRRLLCLVTSRHTSNELFDISRIHPIFAQRYSIKIRNNTQEFKSKSIRV